MSIIALFLLILKPYLWYYIKDKNMRKYKQKFIWRNIFYSNFVIIILIIFIILISRGIFNLFQKYQMSKNDKDFVIKEKIEAEHKMDFSRLKLDNINTEDGKERYIRETYPVKKEGEDLILIYDTPSSTYIVPKSESNWLFIKRFIKNLFVK